jgi:hypothetical protein
VIHTVTVEGLQAKPQNNGKLGIMIGHQNQRIQVRLQDDDGKELACKPVNLVRTEGLKEFIDKGGIRG